MRSDANVEYIASLFADAKGGMRQGGLDRSRPSARRGSVGFLDGKILDSWGPASPLGY